MKLVFVLFLLGGLGFLLLNFSLGVFDDLFSLIAMREGFLDNETKKQAIADLLSEEAGKEISILPPLRIFEQASLASLSSEGVFQWTNIHRQEAQLSSLQRNVLLDEIAARKIQDMFSRQYFEHVSPSGENISDGAEHAGYEFIAIGENLALGNYASDQALVQAWMDSPGHRENILGARYQEIGIALKQGLFEGKTTWLAVQVFALPLSACDVPSETVKHQIDFEKIQIEALAFQLEQMAAELEEQRPKFGPWYNKKVAEYNAKVEEYNSLVADVRIKINTYNMQVQEFNECVKP